MSRRLFTVVAVVAALTTWMTVRSPSSHAPRGAAPPAAAPSASTSARLVLTPLPGHARRLERHYEGPRQSTGPWTELKNPPPFGTPGTMLLESNGDVLVHSEPYTGGTNVWWQLAPNSKGSYVDGTWSQIASMPKSYDPLYFASAVLPDGRMIVEGGEYLDGKPSWTNQGAIYNPVDNTWTSVAPPKGWANIGDAASEVLDNGTFMLQQACNTCTTEPDFTVDEALLDAKNLTWKVVPSVGKDDPNDEEGWTLLPDGKVLTVDTWAPGDTQLFNPANDTWSFAGTTSAKGNPLNPFPVVEIGPQAEMPGGNVFVVGAGGATFTTCDYASTETGLYDYSTGKWLAGPQILPVGGLQLGSTDGPAATLPDGNVLFDASACVYDAPTYFFLYDAANNTISELPGVPYAIYDSSFYTRMLDLPNGQVLFNDGSSQMYVYTAGGSPQASWAPTISSVSTSSMVPGGTYRLSGTQLAGLDQGAVYGDDVQDSTNFPLVRITNTATGTVTYARSFGWTSVQVAPGTKSSTSFVLSKSTPAGASTLQVVANGIASAPKKITVR